MMLGWLRFTVTANIFVDIIICVLRTNIYMNYCQSFLHLCPPSASSIKMIYFSLHSTICYTHTHTHHLETVKNIPRSTYSTLTVEVSQSIAELLVVSCMTGDCSRTPACITHQHIDCEHRDTWVVIFHCASPVSWSWSSRGYILMLIQWLIINNWGMTK